MAARKTKKKAAPKTPHRLIGRCVPRVFRTTEPQHAWLREKGAGHRCGMSGVVRDLIDDRRAIEDADLLDALQKLLRRARKAKVV